MERAGFNFGSLIANILLVLENAEHDYETMTAIKVKGIYDEFFFHL